MISEFGPTTHRFLLGDLASHLGQWAYWRGVRVPGRFFEDPHEVALPPVEPGLGTEQNTYYMDRTTCPQPWPTVGDQLTIRGQVYDIVECGRDDIGELSFRLAKEQLGLSHVTSEGGLTRPAEHHGPGRPTRRPEIVSAFEDALAAGEIEPTQPLLEIVHAMRPRIGNGQGLKDKTLLKIVGDLVRERRHA